jgi:hypothetical protein
MAESHALPKNGRSQKQILQGLHLLDGFVVVLATGAFLVRA